MFILHTVASVYSRLRFLQREADSSRRNLIIPRAGVFSWVLIRGPRRRQRQSELHSMRLKVAKEEKKKKKGEAKELSFCL